MLSQLHKKCKSCLEIFDPKCWNAVFCSTLCKSKFHSKKYYHAHKDECLDKKKEFKRVCNHVNLQPLWAIDNIRKGNT